MKTVFLNLKEGNKTSVKTLTINSIVILDEPFVDMENYLDKDTTCVFIHFKHQQNSYLNLTKVSPYVLLFFDENLMYTGATHSIRYGSGSFGIQTQYKFILFIRMPHHLNLNDILSLQIKTKKYKYLNYVPAPVNLEPIMYDLVNDEDFCTPDGRIPILMVIQYGIFPNGNYEGKKDYSQLEGLENQNVGFIRRAYLSNREYDGIIECLLDKKTLKQFRNKLIPLDWNLWNKKI